MRTLNKIKAGLSMLVLLGKNLWSFHVQTKRLEAQAEAIDSLRRLRAKAILKHRLKRLFRGDVSNTPIIRRPPGGGGGGDDGDGDQPSSFLAALNADVQNRGRFDLAQSYASPSVVIASHADRLDMSAHLAHATKANAGLLPNDAFAAVHKDDTTLRAVIIH